VTISRGEWWSRRWSWRQNRLLLVLLDACSWKKIVNLNLFWRRINNFEFLLQLFAEYFVRFWFFTFTWIKWKSNKNTIQLFQKPQNSQNLFLISLKKTGNLTIIKSKCHLNLRSTWNLTYLSHNSLKTSLNTTFSPWIKYPKLIRWNDWFVFIAIQWNYLTV
jgi:hypothetical protein